MAISIEQAAAELAAAGAAGIVKVTASRRWIITQESGATTGMWLDDRQADEIEAALPEGWSMEPED